MFYLKVKASFRKSGIAWTERTSFAFLGVEQRAKCTFTKELFLHKVARIGEREEMKSRHQREKSDDFVA